MSKPTENLLNPTEKLYKFFNTVYKHFNESLFHGELSDTILTLQRQANTMGYFSANRWTDNNGNNIHEIALNPQYFASFPLLELFQTMVHEQCHLWQEEYGNPSRTGYHNKEWANKMESVGLMPSTTGKEGGRKVGQKVADYAIANSKFVHEALKLSKSKVLLPFYDRRTIQNKTHLMQDNQVMESPSIQAIETTNNDTLLLTEIASIDTIIAVSKPNNSRLKYSCPLCSINLWGKPNLQIMCMDCDCQIVLAE